MITTSISISIPIFALLSVFHVARGLTGTEEEEEEEEETRT